MIYVACALKEEAESIGRTVIKDRLAACANIIDGSRSICRWKGKIEEANEAVLLLKTTAEQVPKIMERVKELHSYECPCIVTIPILEGNKEYLAWMENP